MKSIAVGLAILAGLTLPFVVTYVLWGSFGPIAVLGLVMVVGTAWLIGDNYLEWRRLQ